MILIEMDQWDGIKLMKRMNPYWWKNIKNKAYNSDTH